MYTVVCLIGNQKETIADPAVFLPATLSRLYLPNLLSRPTDMDSELRKSLLKAPSTPVSAALVRPLLIIPRIMWLTPRSHPTLLPHSVLCPSTFNLGRTGCEPSSGEYAADGKQRTIVLDFLCHSSHTNTARAFSRECTVRDVNVDADGDEIMTGDGGEELASGEDADLNLSEDTLKQVELRKGGTYVFDIPKPSLRLFVA